jgi:ribosomal protein S20
MATASKAKKKTVRLASGRKRVRQDEKINAANTSLRSKFRTVINSTDSELSARYPNRDDVVAFKSKSIVPESLTQRYPMMMGRPTASMKPLSSSIEVTSWLRATGTPRARSSPGCEWMKWAWQTQSAERIQAG